MAYVNPLDPTTPLGSDAVSQGDDMFRLVKSALIERMDSFFTGHDVQPWQAKSGSGAASLWIVSDTVEAVTRLAYTGAGSRSVELFANSTVAGLRDTTGPLTILSYTYSSALTVLNTTGSMQLKVGVGQTIQTIVNGVTIGTWSSTGFTVAAGTTAVQALTATTGGFSGAVSAASIAAGTGTNHPAPLSRVTSAAGFAYLAFGNGDVANTHVAIGGASSIMTFGTMNDVGTFTEGMRLTAGTVTINNGLTVSAGGLTVASGATSLQATIATQLAATSAVTNGASRTTLSFGDIAGTGRVTAYGANAATIGVLDFVLLSSDGSVGYAPAGRMTGGIFAWGTTVTTGALVGNIVLPNGIGYCSANAAGTSILALLNADSSNRTVLRMNGVRLVVASALTSALAPANGTAAPPPANPYAYLLANVAGQDVGIPCYIL